MGNSLIKTGAASEFLWAAGIEDTFVPQAKNGQRPLDEYELMGHYEHWREDLDLARELGLNAIRWGVPWYKVEPEKGTFDWSWTDKVIPYMVEELKITPILDLMHYGTPFWLKREFASPDYPKYVEAYAAAFAERYKGVVKWYTPLNEPIINSLMCGLRGLWPPYLKGDAGYIRVMLQLVRGIIRTVKAIKSIDPESVMFHVEATGMTRTARKDLEGLAREEKDRGHICFDLISGRIQEDHSLFSWLVRNGASPDALDEITDNAIELDVLGLNFYPQWSTKLLYIDNRGRLAFKETEPEGLGFKELITDHYERYKVPIMITETSAVGSDEIRERWLESSTAMIKDVRAAGVPVIGYTWFPLFTMIDWRYRFGQEPLESYYLELGLYKLNREHGKRWLETMLVEKMKQKIRDPLASIGDLALSQSVISEAPSAASKA
ncbi:MAG: glycoside hydrolase family 1 protein [Acidobacteria bacterium]|nr:glycoside hydrolase family 1 protein [Acidobacteriota bacterium]